MMEAFLALTTLNYDTWTQLDNVILSWTCQSTVLAIVQSLSHIKPKSALWRTLQTIYANKSNISHTMEIFESMFTSKQGGQSLQDHFGRPQSL